MATTTLTDYLRQSPTLYNLILFSPLLILGAIILFLLQRADSLRQGAGLQSIPEPQPIHHGEDALDEEHYNDEEVYENDDDITQFLNEAAGEDMDDDPLNDDINEDDNIPNQNGVPPPPPTQPIRPINTRQVGKKKARSLEQRDRRRAYHEFLQQQALERRAQQTTIDEEEEERTFAEKQRRAVIEIKIEQKRAREREEKRKEDEALAKSVVMLKEFVKKMGSGKISCKELGRKVGREEGWVKNVLKEEKMVGMVDEFVVMVTEDGQLVKVGAKELSVLKEELAKRKEMNWKEISLLLETNLSRRF